MKYLEYLLVIIIIGILVFVGVELFRNKENQNLNNNTTNTQNNSIENSNNTNNNETDNTNENDIKNNETSDDAEIKNGEELLEKADKKLTARGWAGASNNIIGLKDNTLYFYNKESKEFKKIATGIEDIYYNTNNIEEIVAKKSDNAEILNNDQTFLIFE